MKNKVELCAPAGNYQSLTTAIEKGADAVYMSLGGDTNLRNFPGLNFTQNELEKGLLFVRNKKKKLFMAVNSFPQGNQLDKCKNAIDIAASLGVDAIIISDFALLQYASEKYPNLSLHVSVQAHTSNYESISYLEKCFDIKRVVLPRIMNIEDIKQLRTKTTAQLEVFGIGLLCINCEGLCFLSSFLTGESINTYGACSSPKFVDFHYEEEELIVKSNNVILSKYNNETKGAYPTPCKGSYRSQNDIKPVFQDLESLNILGILPEILGTGVNALKLEGRQRGKAYVERITAAFREALDLYYANKKSGKNQINNLFEGMKPSYGCYKKDLKD